MKKGAVLLLAFVLLFSVTAISESSKYAAMSLEELVKERNEIEAEIAKRVGSSSVIHSGKYVVGKHIKPGTYTLTVLETFDDVRCQVGKSVGDQYESMYMGVGDSTIMFLEDDPNNEIVLVLKTGAFSIIPVNPDWVP